MEAYNWQDRFVSPTPTPEAGSRATLRIDATDQETQVFAFPSGARLDTTPATHHGVLTSRGLADLIAARSRQIQAGSSTEWLEQRAAANEELIASKSRISAPQSKLGVQAYAQAVATLPTRSSHLPASSTSCTPSTQLKAATPPKVRVEKVEPEPIETVVAQSPLPAEPRQPVAHTRQPRAEQPVIKDKLVLIFGADKFRQRLVEVFSQAINLDQLNLSEVNRAKIRARVGEIFNSYAVNFVAWRGLVAEKINLLLSKIEKATGEYFEPRLASKVTSGTINFFEARLKQKVSGGSRSLHEQLYGERAA